MLARMKRKNSRYPDLAPHHDYVVIGIEAGDFRILNDRGLPYLYPARLFEIVDAREPKDWIKARGEDNELYAYPLALNRTGFFEDFFDQKKEAVATFWQALNQRLAANRIFRRKPVTASRIKLDSRLAA